MEKQVRKRSLLSRFVGLLVVFAAGVGVGYYLGDRGKAAAVAEAIRGTEEQVGVTAREAAARGEAALQSIGGGAAAAAESAKAAVRSLRGDTAARPD